LITLLLGILRKGLFQATALLNREDSRIRDGVFAFGVDFFAAMLWVAQPRQCYQLVAKLGEGRMGAVYKARHTKMERLVALKVLPPHVL